MTRPMILAAVTLTAIGCGSDSDRVAELATRHATQQSELSCETVELQTELAEGTQQLIGTDAQARRDFLELQEKLDEQRVEIGRRRDELSEARHDLMERQSNDPVIATAVISIGTLATCLLPLFLAGCLLRCQFDPTDDHLSNEILLDEIAALHLPLPALDRIEPTLAHGEATPRITDHGTSD
jgi:hypothetical protein